MYPWLLFLYLCPVPEHERYRLIPMNDTVVDHYHPERAVPFFKNKRLLSNRPDKVDWDADYCLLFNQGTNELIIQPGGKVKVRWLMFLAKKSGRAL